MLENKKDKQLITGGNSDVTIFGSGLSTGSSTDEHIGKSNTVCLERKGRKCQENDLRVLMRIE